jgi:hypothetical protein
MTLIKNWSGGEMELIIGMLIGATIFVAGMGFGRVWPARRRGPRLPKPTEAICGCGDHKSYHEAGTGICGQTEKVMTSYDKRGNPIYQIVPCGCKQYTGPEPLPELYAPEIQS